MAEILSVLLFRRNRMMKSSFLNWSFNWTKSRLFSCLVIVVDVGHCFTRRYGFLILC